MRRKWFSSKKGSVIIRDRKLPSRTALWISPFGRLLNFERLEKRELLSISMGAQFGGMNENYASWYPLQITAAEGPNFVVDVAGGQMAIFSQSGQFIENISMSANWTSNGNSGSGANGDNPTVVYDPTVAGGGRYIICNGVSTVYFGISKTSDPTQGWYWYTVTFPDSGDGGRFGFNNSAYFVWYSSESSSSVPNTIVIQKSSILSGGTMVSYSQIAPGHPTLQVDDSLSYGSGSGDPAWFYSSTQLIKETNYLSASPTETTYNITGGTFATSKYAEIRTINGVETMAGVDDEASLSWASNGVSSLYWSEVNVTTATVIQSGSIANPSGWSDMGYAYSSLAPNGDIGITWLDATASGTEMAMFITGRSVSDPAGTMETPIAAFTGTYDGTRVGDYGSVNADINNDTFWATEYSDSHPGYTSIVNFGLTNTAPAVMQPVMGFGATPSNGTTVNLQWDAVPGATSYEIERSSDDVTFTEVASGLPSTSYTDTPGGTVAGLYYQVLAFNGQTDSAAPTAIQVTLAPTPPTYDSLTAPTGLAAVLAASGTGIQLSWNSVPSGSSYFLWRSTTGSTWTQIATITSFATLTYSDSSLTGGQLYYYRIATRDSSGGQSSPSSSITIVNRPSAPTVTVDTGWAYQLQVDWNLIPSATSYTVLRSTDGVNYSTLGISPANDTTYTDFTASPNTEYWYEVVANSTVGNSTPAAASGTTSLPTVTGLTVTQGSAQLALQWTSVTAATSYEVQRSTDDVNFSVIAVTSATSYTDTGATPLVTYYYRITAVDATTGVSSASASAVVFSTATPTTSLPYGWQSQDVGVSNIGAAGFSAGQYTLVGYGSDIWNASDQFHYAYIPVTGNVTIIAKVNSETDTGGWVKAGVMIRNSLSASDQYALECITPSNGSAFQYRTTSGSDSGGTSGDTGPATPYWVKLVRSGNTITGYRSANGTTWTQDGSVSITFTNSTIYVGLELDTDTSAAVTSTATFSNVSVTNTSLASPTVATAAAASPGTVTGTTTSLSVLGADATGASNLYYTWSATSLPSGASQPTFSPNSTNAAQNTTATFSQAGTYTLTATITNGYGLTVTSPVTVTVSQTMSGITVVPSSAFVSFVGTAQFTAYDADQFGNAMGSAITPTWSISPSTGAGTISSTGLYTAPSTQTSATITAVSGSYSASTAVQVFNRDTWTNTAGGSWATTTNWQGSTIASGAGVAADFSTLALTAAPTVTLNGAETIGDLLFSDTNNSYGWTLNTGTGGPLTLSSTSGTPTIAVTNQTTTIGAVLAGTAGLTKTGTGVLNLTGAGTWTGTTTVAAGTLIVGAKASSVDVPYVVDAGATLKIGYTTGGGYATTAMTLNGSGLNSAAGVYLDGGTLYNVSGGFVIQGAPTVIHQYGTGLAEMGIFDINSTPGLSVTAAASGSSMDPNIELVNEGYGMVVTTAAGADTATGDLTVNGPLSVGSLGLYKEGTGSLLLNGYASTSNVAVNIKAGTVITGVNNSLGVDANVPISSGATLELDGTTQNIANLSGAGAIIGASATTSSLIVNESSANTYSGVIGGTGTNQNNLSFSKAGTAALTVAGSNTFTGGTTIVAGTLLATNTSGSATGSGSVTVDSGATLGGTGKISGAVTVESAGNLTPGTSGIGTLSIANTLALAGNVNMDINVTAGTSSLIQSVTTLTYGGTLYVANLAGTLIAGKTFKLFSAMTYSGSFSTFNLPTLSLSLGWNTSTLTTNGTISVVVTGTATVATPASAIWTAGGTTVALSVLGADAAGQADLTYTWSYTGPAGVTYSVNGTNAAQNSTATLTTAGTYTFTATIADVQGPSATSSATVTVGQTVTTIVMTPATVSLGSAGTQQFSATAKDQFGSALSTQPSFTWSVATGVGSINTSGLYTASYASGTATVTASNSGVASNTSSIAITDAAPTVAAATAATPATVNGTTTALSVLGADSDGGGQANLTYTWSVTSKPSGAATPTFSINGTNAAQNTMAAFSQAGSYAFLAKITDLGGMSTTSSVTVTVAQTVTTISVSQPSTVVQAGTSQADSATAYDQFGAVFSIPPTFAWSSTVGQVTSSGLFTAQATSAVGTVMAAVGSVQGSVAVRVDLPPLATADSYPAIADRIFSVAAPGVLADDTGTSGTSLTAVLVGSETAHGQLSLAANGSFQYTPNTGFTGTDSFSYEAFDGYFYSSPMTVTITIGWPTWTGAGSNNHWTTAANWANGLAPQAGDELFFPAGAQLTSYNDFPDGTQFQSMTLEAGGIDLEGSSINLTSPGGTAITSSGNGDTINVPISLQAAATISVTAGSLTILSPLGTGGTIQNGGNQLTVDAAAGATVNLTGAMSGAGSIAFTGPGTVNTAAAGGLGGSVTVTSGTYDINGADGFPSGGSLIIGSTSSGNVLAASSVVAAAKVAAPLAISRPVASVAPTAKSVQAVFAGPQMPTIARKSVTLAHLWGLPSQSYAPASDVQSPSTWKPKALSAAAVDAIMAGRSG